MEDNILNPELQPQHDQSNPESQPSSVNNDINEHRPTPQESFQEIQRLEQAERERNEAVGFIKQLEHYALQQQQLQQQRPEPEPVAVSYDDDDIIEGRHLKAEFASLKRELQEQKKNSEYARKIAEENAMANAIRYKYNDFDSVVTKENIEKLRAVKPELAESLHRTPDGYNKAVAVYTILKDLGIARNTVSYNEDHIKAQNNINKPRTSSALSSQNSVTSLAHASAFSNGPLSQERKDQIYQNMLKNAKKR